jgi:beta-lactamase class A
LAAAIHSAQTTNFLHDLGLTKTFIVAPYVIDPENPLQPTIPIILPTTEADQHSAEPDPSNQVTVDEMGWLLSGIYQCAFADGGPLLERFGASFTSGECRQMLYLMSNNTIGELIEAGVPAGTRVAHKHGWINDTHGDAGVVFTPGGNYVLVMTLYNPTWLDFGESFPLMAEISRTVYNHYNADAPMPEIERKQVPAECNLLGNPLIENLMTGKDGT